jgi:hypothetical protein|tara:strand:+ start:1926 stop:2153 length:228 start_codon:yes stop_codon:yes gene_type:complete
MYYRIDGVKDEDVGRIMAKWAYIGVGVGLLATYSYLGLLKNNKQKLLIGSLFTLGGLAIGSYIGTSEVEKLKKEK